MPIPTSTAFLSDGLFLPAAEGQLSFTPLPAPTTREIEELTVQIARRQTEVMDGVLEDGSEQRLLDPDWAALYEALLATVVPSKNLVHVA
jgi:hypothetical protein